MAAVSLIRGAFSLALVVGCGSALAQPSAVSWPNVVLKYATDGTPLLHPRVPLASTAAGGGAATLNATQRLAIGSASANLNLTRNVPVANLAKVARIAARVLGPLAVLGLAYDGVQWVGEQWMADGELPPDVTIVSVTDESGLAQCSTWSFPGYSTATGPNYDWIAGRVNVASPGGQPPPAGYLNVVNCLVEGVWYDVARRPKQCVIGAHPATGECITQGESVPATDQQLEISFQQGLIASPSLAGQVLDAALASSAARAELLADAMGISGPASVDGGTKTSTKVDTAGTTTIQTATTYNLSYSGDTVTVTQTNVETVTDPASNVTTTTTTTEAPAGDPPSPEEKSKFCEDFPDASACQELGEPEEEPDLPEESRDLSFDQELSDAGSCPAPYALSILGNSYSLEWTPLCQLASGVRPVVIALAWLSAIVFVFAVGSRTT